MAQIGTIEVQTQNNGIVQLPVFDTGDDGSEVYDMVRAQTASGTGFIPMVDPADAKFPYLRVQTENHNVLAAHNSPDFIIDDFEDNDLSEYQSNTGNWTVTSAGPTSPRNGTYYLTNSTDTAQNNGIFSYPGNGLTNYFPYGTDSRVWVYLGVNDVIPEIVFGKDSSSDDNADHYEIDLDDVNNKFALEDVGINGSTQGTSEAYVTDADGGSGWYELEIRWGTTSNEIEIELFDDTGTSQNTLTSNSANHQSKSGIGFQAETNSAEEVAYDYWRLV